MIVIVSTGKAALPIVSLAMIGAVYGLQAIIFLLKREFMLIGWMIIYILVSVSSDICARILLTPLSSRYPVYSFFLPIYAFWSMDDFSWGNTHVVVGEGRDKGDVYNNDEGFDESVIPFKKFSGTLLLAMPRSTLLTSGPIILRGRGSRLPRAQVSIRQLPSRFPRTLCSPVPGFQQSHSRQGSHAASSVLNSPHSAGGDYYQNTNVTYNNLSNPNLRLPPLAVYIVSSRILLYLAYSYHIYLSYTVAFSRPLLIDVKLTFSCYMSRAERMDNSKRMNWILCG